MYKGERFNSISHLVGAALAAAGLAVLVAVFVPAIGREGKDDNSRPGDPRHPHPEGG